IALTHEDAVERPNATWHDWYDFLPWEDWRMGQPAIIGEHIEPALSRWVRDSQKSGSRQQREERVNVTFGQTGGSEMDSVLCPERYELLYEAGLVAEASRDYRAANPAVDQELTQQPPFEMGMPLASDYRRILATALGRLRGKLAYRPVVFELLPGEFTLLQLQRVAEALSGAELHKQNFRRLVINADLVESVGRNQAHSRGRPAELFRFRREVLGEKLTVGLSRPMLRGSGAGHSG
ncbi:MAG: NUDIX hydrolase, partial [Alphaproteobacteria bacterium]